jgi:sarcosine oxidase
VTGPDGSVSRTDYRYGILGLGAIGSAAAYWLARRAQGDVIGLERFELGHTHGASEDHSRIIRRSYHTPWYVGLTAHAYRVWEEVEARAAERLIVRTGGLDLWPEGAVIPMSDYTDSMRAGGVEFEELDAGEIMRRWPPWTLSGDVRGLFQADAGLCAASRCNAAHRRLAREEGADIRDRSPVTAIRAGSGEIELETAAGRVRCETLVVAVDSWTNQVLGMLGERPLPLTMTKEQVVYFAVPDAGRFSPDRFPIWIWMDDPCFYGFPAFGEAGPKVAQDVGGEPTDLERLDETPDPAALERVRRFTEERLPAASGPILSLRTCRYTMPPDRHFVVDRLPAHPNVIVLLGAAHGFKFSSLFGKIAAELAVDGASPHDLGRFAVDRPILTKENPPASFLI